MYLTRLTFIFGCLPRQIWFLSCIFCWRITHERFQILTFPFGAAIFNRSCDITFVASGHAQSIIFTWVSF